MIYLDHAATTPMSKDCADVYVRYATELFYNPSARYRAALECANAVREARKEIARCLGAKSEDEIIFTASGSEADNLALLCSIKAKHGKVLIGGVEHSAVYETARALEARGYQVEFLPCDAYGKTDLGALRAKLTNDVVLVSVMHVCNETGCINDLQAIASLVHSMCPHALVHSDGVQAFGKIPVSVASLGVDMYSISAHKIHGPKGVGALYCRQGLFLRPIIYGGGQERNIRSATENVGGIVAFARAAKTAMQTLRARLKHARECKARFLEGIHSIADLRICSPADGSPYIVLLSVAQARGEVIVHEMQDRGFLIGTGSACSSHKAVGRIPTALGLSPSDAQGMLRISFGQDTTLEQIDACTQALQESIEKTRAFQRQ